MFLAFFELLRSSGLKISVGEWMTLLEGLRQGLHRSSLSGFYVLCRAVLVHSEADFDLFDRVFLAFFENVEQELEVSEQLLQWLDHPELNSTELLKLSEITGLDADKIEELFAQRLQEQDDEHNGGRRWIGTGGYTPFGHHGQKAGGIRVGGRSAYRSAYRVAGERRYEDWRRDSTIDSRQFQMAFRNLRQMSCSQELPKTELDMDATIRKTCDRGGNLDIEFVRPRRNGVKMMLLIDSGGSMDFYRELCSLLFQSVNKAGGFKDLKIYYFHNTLESKLYLDPTLDWRETVPVEWVLNNLSSDYKVVILADALMSADELMGGGRWYRSQAPEHSGLAAFLTFKHRYPHLIWLHPQPRPRESGYWTQSFEIIEQYFDMYQLSLDGLNAAMKKLMVNR